MIAQTPKPPYYAVIFTSFKTGEDNDGYALMAQKMFDLAALQEGFLGVESVRENLGITVSYWDTEAHILQWKKNTEHVLAQQMGIEKWYQLYKIRICKVERDYGFERL